MAKAKLSTPVTILRPAETTLGSWHLPIFDHKSLYIFAWVYPSILRVKMFSTLTISTVGASFLMHLLLHRECILNGPQEGLGNSKAFTIILLPVSAPPRLKMDETTWNNNQLVQAFVYRSYLVDFQNLLETNWMTKYRVSTKCIPDHWQLFFFRRSLHRMTATKHVQIDWTKALLHLFGQPSIMGQDCHSLCTALLA